VLKKSLGPAWRQQGFSLLEVLIAFTILATVMTPMFHCFYVAVGTNTNTALMGTALALAQSKMEETINEPYAAVVDQTERDFSAEAGYHHYGDYRYTVAVTENSPVSKTVEVQVSYMDSFGNRKEVTLTGEITRR